jgi:hypothetical protein
MANDIKFVNTMVIKIDCTHHDGEIFITVTDGQVTKVEHGPYGNERA